MDDSTLKRAFLDSGWKQQEVMLYLKLLELGEQPASVLASKVQKNRITTYHALERMVEKGWLSKRRQVHGFTYSCNEAENILSNLYNEREILYKKLSREAELFAGILPYLSQIQGSSFKKPVVDTFYGDQSLRQIYTLSLEAKEMFAYYEPFSSDQYPELLDTDDWHTAERIKRHIPVKIILPNTPNSLDFAAVRKPLKQVKIVQNKEFTFKDLMLITDSRVLIYSLKDKMGVSIQSTNIAHNQIQQFTLLWSLL